MDLIEGSFHTERDVNSSIEICTAFDGERQECFNRIDMCVCKILKYNCMYFNLPVFIFRSVVHLL